VEPQLLFEIRIAPAAAQRADQTMNPLAEQMHGNARFRIRRAATACMIVVIRSQASFSFASSRRPAAVSA
jgi:hypothetical protein